MGDQRRNLRTVCQRNDLTKHDQVITGAVQLA